LLLINNYSKHIYWIFINGLSHTDICLCAAARSHDLIAVNAFTAGQNPPRVVALIEEEEECFYSFH